MLPIAWTIFGLRIDRPVVLLIALLTVPLAVVSWRWMRGIRPVRRAMAILLRSAAVFVLVAALAGTQCEQETDRLQVFFLVDRSLSVGNVMEKFELEGEDRPLDATERYLLDRLGSATGSVREIDKEEQVTRTRLSGEDEASVILFDGRAYVDVAPDSAFAFDYIRTPTREPVRTNLAAAMSMARGLFKPGFNQRIVIITDGVENAGNALAEAQLFRAQAGRRKTKIPIEVVRLEYDYAPEVLVERLDVPARANKGQTVWLRATLRTRGQSSGELTLLENGRPIDLDPNSPGKAKKVELTKPLTAFRLPVPMESGGLHHFELRFRPSSKELDHLPDNNHATGFCYVRGLSRILVVDSEWTDNGGRVTGPCAPFADALKQKKIHFVGITPDQFPASLAALQTYDAVILSNVRADAIGEQQHKMIERYVHDFGGGLIMVGGPESFGAGDWMGTPVEKALPVTMDIRHIEKKLKGALVLIMHSIEMNRGNYWGLRIAKAAVRVLTSKDEVGVMCYDFGAGGAIWAYKLAPAANKPYIYAQIDKMEMGDMPDFGSAMVLGRDALIASDAATKHMVIISDGDPTRPTPELLDSLVKNKITVSTVTVGFNGMHPPSVKPMKVIAKWCKGKHYAVRNANRLPTIFTREAKRVRRSLITEKPFMPAVHRGASRRIIKDLTGFPALRGMVLTTPKPKPLAHTPLMRAGKQGGSGDPVLAHWSYGIGTTAAFTSDYKGRWGRDWISWPGYASFWDQLIRVVARGSVQDNIRVQTFAGDAKPFVEIEALDEQGGFIDDLALDVRAVGPDFEAHKVDVSPVGPGLYRGHFAARQTGDYFIRVKYRRPMSDGKHREGIIVSGYTVSYSPEFRRLTSNDELLDAMATETGGRIVGRTRRPITGEGAGRVQIVPVGNVDLFSHDMPPIRALLPIWQSLLVIALCLFLADVFSRRVMIDWSRVRRAIISWGVTRSERREAAGSLQTLSSLRTQREAAQETRQRSEPKVAYRPPAPAAEDIPLAPPPPAAAPRREREREVEEGGSLTDRLKRAKERARRRMDDGDGD